MINNIIEYISKYVQLEFEEIKAINELILIKEFKKGTLLLKEGEIAKFSYFNIKGCIRSFSIVEGVEKTTHFYTENQFVTSIKSFTKKVQATHYLECIEDCMLGLLSLESEIKLLNEFPKLEHLSRILLEEELAMYQDILSSYITTSPEERYKNLLKLRPDLFQRIPQYHIATYLGITPQSLSRIRNRIII